MRGGGGSDRRKRGARVYSMSYQAAQMYLAAAGGRRQQAPPGGSAGRRRRTRQALKDPAGAEDAAATARNRLFYIPYTGKPGAYYDGVSIARVIRGEVPADYWAGRIVLIGPYAAALQDAYFTPIDKGEQMYGVEIQANMIQSFSGKFCQKRDPRSTSDRHAFCVVRGCDGCFSVYGGASGRS